MCPWMIWGSKIEALQFRNQFRMLPESLARSSLDFQGMKLPGTVHTAESINYAWKELKVFDDDVFNVTYPKSGTTWIQEILSLIYSNGDPTPVKTEFSWDRVPWIEQHAHKAKIESLTSPRLLTTHLPLKFFPQNFHKSKAKVIYTIRNPKDVCVSLYYFCKIAQFMEFREDFQEFVARFLSKDEVYSGWFEHVKGWLTLKGQPNILFLSYEAMLKNPRENIVNICKFLGKDLDDAAIDSVVTNSSFKAMKENGKSNYSAVPKFIFNQDEVSFYRKGIAGDHKNHFTPALDEEFDKTYHELMKDVDLTFT
uniref:Sulfotransferase n=2 Tax=Leptobrachium leishanense TaxID=445787 RepID=A0A8C5MNA0_9ANUR